MKIMIWNKNEWTMDILLTYIKMNLPVILEDINHSFE
jgi:hypothetical protein